MPRRRSSTDSTEGAAVDQAAREYGRAEKAADAKRQALHQRIREAHASGMTISEIARRANYTREYVSALVNGKDQKETA